MSPLALFALEVRFKNVETKMKKEQELRQQVMKKGYRAGFNKHAL